MRVIAGTRRSLPLKSVEGEGTRPTLDRYKETLFNILMPYIPGCRFLDLFAGSGAVGIEALSRGAESAVFVEQAREAIRCIEENIRFTKFEKESRVVKGDALNFIRGLREVPYDVIFIDPPYGKELEKEALLLLSGKQFADPETVIVVEADLSTDFSYVESDTIFTVYKEKNYKTNRHLFLRIKGEQ